LFPGSHRLIADISFQARIYQSTTLITAAKTRKMLKQLNLFLARLDSTKNGTNWKLRRILYAVIRRATVPPFEMGEASTSKGAPIE
jgi:hypothetical protein